MADVALLAPTVQDAGGGYQVPGAQEIILKCCTASYDGTAASGNYLPALQIVAPNGAVMGTFPVAAPVTMGGSVDVSWFPRGGLSSDSAVSPSVVKAVYAVDAAADTQGQVVMDFSTLVYGEQLFDVSDPTNPLALASGLYIYTLVASADSDVAATSPGQTFVLFQDMATNTDDVFTYASFPLQTLHDTPFTEFAKGTVTLSYYIAAGDGIDGLLRMDVSALPLSWTLTATISFVPATLS